MLQFPLYMILSQETYDSWPEDMLFITDDLDEAKIKSMEYALSLTDNYTEIKLIRIMCKDFSNRPTILFYYKSINYNDPTIVIRTVDSNFNLDSKFKMELKFNGIKIGDKDTNRENW